MSWTNFRNRHLFSVNLALVAAFTLWQFRKDLQFHWIIGLWVFLGFFIPQLRAFEKKAMLTLGKINGTILMTVFYFCFFTPFSFLYRWLFRHQSFRKSQSTFIPRSDACDFSRPF